MNLVSHLASVTRHSSKFVELDSTARCQAKGGSYPKTVKLSEFCNPKEIQY